MQKQDKEKIPNANRENWNVTELAEQSANEESDETMRKVLRGNEEKGNPDDRDVAGAANSDETPQGREENKKQTGVEKND